jgi:hypothetical protein
VSASTYRSDCERGGGGRSNGQGFGDTQSSDPDAVRKQCFVRFVVMAVNDKADPAGFGESVDHREAVRMARWRFMGHEDVEAGRGQGVEVFRENRVPMEQRQAVAPDLARS